MQNLPGLIENEHHVERFVENHLKFFLQVVQLFLGARALAPFGGLAQFPFHGGDQPREVGLHHVIVGPGAHRGHRRFLADAAGNDDERQHRRLLAQQVQGAQRIELRQRVIRQHDFPAPLRERFFESLGGLHPVAIRLVTAPAEGTQHERRVVRVVLDEQQPQRLAGGVRASFQIAPVGRW